MPLKDVSISRSSDLRNSSPNPVTLPLNGFAGPRAHQSGTMPGNAGGMVPVTRRRATGTAAIGYQRASRKLRPSDALAFCLRYSA
jgi:hypothetical protein